jgi:predicted ATPase
MERLKVKNFLIIKECDIDVGRLTLIIGPQASGKSIIAKLIYFSRQFFSTSYLLSVQNLETKKELEKRGKADFGKYFPKYAWNEQEFEIVYQINETELSLVHRKSKNGKLSLKLDYSKNLAILHQKLKSAYRKKQAEYPTEETTYMKSRAEYSPTKEEVFWEIAYNYTTNSEVSDLFRRIIFIPAGRSFFANLQKNVFSFLASSIDIDPFIKSFGSDYAISKKYYSPQSTTRVESKIKSLTEAILVGKYRYENEQDWIEHKNGKVNVSNASSGQQEALPMLVILSVFPFFLSQNRNRIFFIEEPEAHLFPVSQKHIVSIIAIIYNQRKDNFVITTHSPYILTAINNLILASEVAKEKSPEEVGKIIDLDFAIRYEDVKAYTIRQGIVESIMDEENRLIGPTVIDSVSDEFDNVFDALIRLQMDE